MHPSHYHSTLADRPAAIMARRGETLTFAELERRSNQGAHLLRSLGLRPGDTICLMIENDLLYFEVYWAAQRSGVIMTPIPTHLTAEEAAYIVRDSGADVLVASTSLGDVTQTLVQECAALMPGVKALLTHGPVTCSADDWTNARAAMPDTPIADQIAGVHMFYSSGTTGRPKGVRLPFGGEPFDAPMPYEAFHEERYGDLMQQAYLSPAPLYHAAPLVACTMMHRFGGTAIVMEKFDPEVFLAAIETYRVTFTQMVPTMFVRLLKLPAETRARYDLSSLKKVIHAAAPCPVDVKHAMLAWWGPIIFEYYAGSEGNGSTFISPEEWLSKPGSVGLAQNCVIHICDDDGAELPSGVPGIAYFEGGAAFSYYKDNAKTDEARNPLHPEWTTLGDIGYLDEDGYLFLTDRKSFMIISGGVNIYPQEAENILVTHPKVYDVAVIGVPHPEMGQQVKAVVQPVDWAEAGPTLECELIDWCRQQLAHVKCPRSIDFDPALPRHDTGKLYKRLIRDRYWEGQATRLL